MVVGRHPPPRVQGVVRVSNSGCGHPLRPEVQIVRKMFHRLYLKFWKNSNLGLKEAKSSVERSFSTSSPSFSLSYIPSPTPSLSSLFPSSPPLFLNHEALLLNPNPLLFYSPPFILFCSRSRSQKKLRSYRRQSQVSVPLLSDWTRSDMFLPNRRPRSFTSRLVQLLLPSTQKSL